MRLVLGADHGGWQLKQELKKWMDKKGWQVEDVGAAKEQIGDDYVDYAVEVAQRLQQEEGAMGVVMCRNGVGMDMSVNRFAGVRCCLGFDAEQVRRARLDDKVNCLAVPTDYLSLEQIKELLEVLVTTEYSGLERYERRLEKLADIGGM